MLVVIRWSTRPSADLCLSHHLAVLADPNNENKLLSLRLLVIRVRDPGVSKRRFGITQDVAQLYQTASASLGNSEFIGKIGLPE